MDYSRIISVVFRWFTQGVICVALSAPSFAFDEVTVDTNASNCVEAIGEYIFFQVENQSEILNHCAFASANYSERRIKELSSLEKYRSRFSQLPEATLNSCWLQWEADWAAALRDAQKEASQILSGTTEAISKIETELVFRSSFDKAITRLAMESGRFYQRLQPNSCENIAANVSFLRSDNVAFLSLNNVADTYSEGALNGAILRPLWFMIQHSDLYLGFQKEWLKRFKESDTPPQVPERLLNSLADRIALAEQQAATKN